MRKLVLATIILCAAAASADGGGPVVESYETLDRSGVRRGLVIESKVGDDRWRQRTALYPLVGEKVALRVKGEAEDVRWYLVFADLTRTYKNANHPWEPNAYAWVGLGRIDYHRVELAHLRGLSEVEPFAPRPDGKGLWHEVREHFRQAGADSWAVDFYHERAGTFWFQAEATRAGRRLRSAGPEDADDRGISRRALRVSVRDGEGYLGYLTSYLNVPGVFGSVLYQSRHHIGVDCADVLIAARARWRETTVEKNFNVQMLVGKFPHVAEVQIEGGAPDTTVTWGEDGVRPGDFIAVGYDQTKRYHHIGALVRDANSNGLLDGDDVALHAGPWPLHHTRLAEGAFDGRVVILRP